MRDRVPALALDDKERDELSRKVREVNGQSEKRPK
ncbi:hypothetical protein SAMN04490357_0198 [Streptomyces misionensis]|uniref:Uncharacterized protein n=1 Tax=Streptomyces misionensis TaxID=67331 RepID=A0A1H4ICA3_9ACTN|nr:hypothetical protein SAMN04490357_0198 [Streptomyces misionensis]